MPSTSQETHVTSLDELSTHLGCPNPGHEQPPSRFRPSRHISGSRRLPYSFDIRPEEADLLIADFWNNMAHHIPFVAVPISTSEDLRRERPILWKAILIAAS
jgi:hypothetical protein